jgi:hypothetical protein
MADDEKANVEFLGDDIVETIGSITQSLKDENDKLREEVQALRDSLIRPDDVSAIVQAHQKVHSEELKNLRRTVEDLKSGTLIDELKEIALSVSKRRDETESIIRPRPVSSSRLVEVGHEILFGQTSNFSKSQEEHILLQAKRREENIIAQHLASSKHRVDLEKKLDFIQTDKQAQADIADIEQEIREKMAARSAYSSMVDDTLLEIEQLRLELLDAQFSRLVILHDKVDSHLEKVKFQAQMAEIQAKKDTQESTIQKIKVQLGYTS